MSLIAGAPAWCEALCFFFFFFSPSKQSLFDSSWGVLKIKCFCYQENIQHEVLSADRAVSRNQCPKGGLLVSVRICDTYLQGTKSCRDATAEQRL